MPKAALYVAGVIFTIAAVCHLLRMVVGFDVIVAGNVVPMWVSLPGLIVAAVLAIWMVLAARRV